MSRRIASEFRRFVSESRRSPRPFGPLPTVLAACVLLALAVPAFGADEPAEPTDASSLLHLRYAEARLKLAKLDLARARAVDEQAGARVVSETDLRRLEARIRVLEGQVEVNRTLPHGNGIHAQVARARAAVEVAEADLAQARELRERNPKALNPIDLDRYATRAEIARLRLALLEDPENVPSIIDQMQLQLDQLTDHVLDLLDQIENQRTITPGERR